MRLVLVSGKVQVDFLPAKGERGAALSERHYLHAHHAAIEIAAAFNACHGENDMVEPVDDNRRGLIHGETLEVRLSLVRERRSLIGACWRNRRRLEDLA